MYFQAKRPLKNQHINPKNCYAANGQALKTIKGQKQFLVTQLICYEQEAIINNSEIEVNWCTLGDQSL